MFKFKEPFRLIDHGRTDAATCMATDELIGWSKPTVKVFRFQKPTFTIGVDQKISTVDIDLIKKDGFDFVRRQSMGTGAIFYQDWLCFCFGCSKRYVEPWNTKSLFHYFNYRLYEAVDKLGIEAKVSDMGNGQPKTYDCFSYLNISDVMDARDRKIGGSTGDWSRHGKFLFHGSLPFDRRYIDIQKYLLEPDEWRCQTVSLNELNPDLTYEDVKKSIFDVFKEKLGGYETDFTMDEKLKIVRLVQSKYLSDEWTFKC